MSCGDIKIPRENDFINHIIELKNSGESIAVWGTGSYMMHIAAVSPLMGCNIKYVVDNNKLKQGQEIYGYTVCSPEELIDFKGTVVITSMLYGDMINKQIKKITSYCKTVYIEY